MHNSHSCENCPAWSKGRDYDGREILVPVMRDGKPVTDGGKPQYELDPDDKRYVVSGNCRLYVPKLMSEANTMVPSSKSNWFCHDPAKYAMLDRFAAEARKNPPPSAVVKKAQVQRATTDLANVNGGR